MKVNSILRYSSLLFCLLVPTVVLSQNNRRDPFRELVKGLPAISHVEISRVKPLLNADVKTADCREQGRLCAPDTFPYEIEAPRVIDGEEAQKFADLWRGLEKDSLHQNDKCFTPDHLLRFFQSDRILLETQVCSLCRKITLPGLGVVSVAGSNKVPYDRFRGALIPDSSFQKDWEISKQTLMPKVGKEITVVGLLVDRKAGLTIAYEEGELLLPRVDLARVNELQNLGCHVALRVSGNLHYAFPAHPQKPGNSEQMTPEFFYIDRPQIEVLRVEKPRNAKLLKN